MMKKFTLNFCLIFVTFSTIFAQTFTTPGTGVNWTLDDIATNSPSTITSVGDAYTLLENLEISENDTVFISTNLTLSIAADLRVTVFGAFNIDADEVTITAVDELTPYDGFRFEEFSTINIQNATIEHGGGLRVLTETFTLNNCTLTNNVTGVTTGGVVSLSRGVPVITNNTFTFNELPAISSPANAEVSAYIFNNYLEGNNQANANRPQINMGATMVDDTLKIIQNTIIGDPSLPMAGGIAVANFVGGDIRAIIDNNTIQGNRYGITILGPNSFAYVRNNIIEDNNIQGDPNLGGSGISLNTSSGVMDVIASNNEIRNNLWGITLLGTASINLGDDLANPGLNIFSENENGGEVYALFNNTPNTISAKHNCWIEGQANTLEDAESVISHNVDDVALGEVIFDPVSCGVTSVSDFNFENFDFYPNPANDQISFDNTPDFDKLDIYNIQGNLIKTAIISQGTNTLSFDLSAGFYILKFSADQFQTIRKMVVE